MATVVQQSLVTVKEFETMVFEFPTDLIQGEVVPMPPPGGVHGRVCLNVGYAGPGNAPFERGAADGEVAQAAADEGDDFIAARFRLDEFRMVAVIIQQRLLELRELEVIIFFLDHLRGPLAIGAERAGRGVIHVQFVVNAVIARVMTLVDEIVFLNLLEEVLHGVRVARFRGADEAVHAEAQILP